MNQICKDCLHAYSDLRGGSYICETCQNGENFTPSVVFTDLTVRQEWPDSPTARLQAAQMAKDILRMTRALDELVGLYLVNGNPMFVETLNYIIRVNDDNC